jgi:ABC-type nickel/cobalt efflux system permease component RcnA
MKTLLQAVSGVALVGTIAPPLLFLLSRIDLDQTKLWMAVSALVWFAATPFWMDREPGA